MKRLIPITLALLLLGAQDCEPPKPNPQGGNDFCYGNNYSILGSLRELTGDFGAGFNAIIDGKPSLERRSTVQVLFGQSYCTGTVIGPRVVITAGHCGYGETTAHTARVYERDGAPAEGEVQPPVIAYADAKTGQRVDAAGPGTFAFNAAAMDDAAGGLVAKLSVVATKHIVHPDYLQYVNSGNTNWEARKADLMLLIMSSDLPGPYPAGIYNHEAQAADCVGGLAQGFGRHEASGLDLRETKYLITRWSDPKALRSVASEVPQGTESGVICFGDSGGGLYMDVDGQLYLAGTVTTTMSADCLAGGTHVNDYHFRRWIADTAEANGGVLAFEVPLGISEAS